MKIHPVVLEIFTCLFVTDRLTDRQTPDYHIPTGETFYLGEKITSPTHYSNFASLICSVCRGINMKKKKKGTTIVIFLLNEKYPDF